MGIRVVQRGHTGSEDAEPAHGAVQKPFLLSDGRVELEASLDRASYCHGDPIRVHVAVHNNSSRTVRRIKVTAKRFFYHHSGVSDQQMISNGMATEAT